MKYKEYSGDDLDANHASLFFAVCNICELHNQEGNNLCGFGKHTNKTLLQMVTKQKSYIDWCKTAEKPSEDMKRLINYAALHDVYLSATATFPE